MSFDTTTLKQNMLMMLNYVILTNFIISAISSFTSKLMTLTKTLQNTSKKRFYTNYEVKRPYSIFENEKVLGMAK